MLAFPSWVPKAKISARVFSFPDKAELTFPAASRALAPASLQVVSLDPELGVVVWTLPGDEGLEMAGLPRLGVVAIKGVAVRDGSTLAMGVISVPMSRIHTVRMFTTPDSPAYTDDAFKPAGGFSDSSPFSAALAAAASALPHHIPAVGLAVRTEKGSGAASACMLLSRALLLSRPNTSSSGYRSTGATGKGNGSGLPDVMKANRGNRLFFDPASTFFVQSTRNLFIFSADISSASKLVVQSTLYKWILPV